MVHLSLIKVCPRISQLSVDDVDTAFVVSVKYLSVSLAFFLYLLSNHHVAY